MTVGHNSLFNMIVSCIMLAIPARYFNERFGDSKCESLKIWRCGGGDGRPMLLLVETVDKNVKGQGTRKRRSTEQL